MESLCSTCQREVSGYACSLYEMAEVFLAGQSADTQTMKTESFEFVGSGGKMLPAVIWQSEEVHAVIQVTHGITEHMGRSDADWLCSDETERMRYLEDPLGRKNISSGLFWELLGSMKRIGSRIAYDGWDIGLPILLISGENDPVGDNGKGVQAVYRHMEKDGMRAVTFQRIPDARHDLLHEERNGAETVRHYIANWLTTQGSEATV